MDSRAQLPARIIRSAHEILLPYFCLIGQGACAPFRDCRYPAGCERRRALRPGACAAAPVAGAVSACAVPRHADEEPPVVAEIGRPPVLRVGHQRVKILLQGLQVEFLELIGVVELPAHRVTHRRMLMENIEVQLVRPPVLVGPSLMSSVRAIPMHYRAFLFVSHFISLSSTYFSPAQTRIGGTYWTFQLICLTLP